MIEKIVEDMLNNMTEQEKIEFIKLCLNNKNINKHLNKCCNKED